MGGGASPVRASAAARYFTVENRRVVAVISVARWGGGVRRGARAVALASGALDASSVALLGATDATAEVVLQPFSHQLVLSTSKKY